MAEVVFHTVRRFLAHGDLTKARQIEFSHLHKLHSTQVQRARGPGQLLNTCLNRVTDFPCMFKQRQILAVHALFRLFRTRVSQN